eukprot:CAMPEP_0195295912 /NCGR_PEP_ID=MMETSP0707-20130614/18322_1 /TAXON_ID=33640 /ORGANISM="Asterionellopsis glacialis, Strain CCMP134" /LENGTH=250 /DNA_ID=CAMNT_0040357251 /DNA_START=78 /DNA_END=830 /DNA_ORIENTATION=-
MAEIVPTPTRAETRTMSKRQEESTPTKLSPSELNLPTPIIVMGLLKCGTTSIYAYFKCGLDLEVSQLSHYACDPDSNLSTHGHISCGEQMRRNIEENGKPIFDGLDQFDVYTQIDAQEGPMGVIIPQHRFLREIHDHFPNATWILNQRDPQSWVSSMTRWSDVRARFIDHHGGPDFPRGVGVKDEEMVDFFNLQAQKVRDFVKDHPSHTLVEVQIDKPEAGQLMEDAFGISKTCWGKKNVNDGNSLWSDK